MKTTSSVYVSCWRPSVRNLTANSPRYDTASALCRPPTGRRNPNCHSRNKQAKVHTCWNFAVSKASSSLATYWSPSMTTIHRNRRQSSAQMATIRRKRRQSLPQTATIRHKRRQSSPQTATIRRKCHNRPQSATIHRSFNTKLVIIRLVYELWPRILCQRGVFQHRGV